MTENHELRRDPDHFCYHDILTLMVMTEKNNGGFRYNSVLHEEYMMRVLLRSI